MEFDLYFGRSAGHAVDYYVVFCQRLINVPDQFVFKYVLGQSIIHYDLAVRLDYFFWGITNSVIAFGLLFDIQLFWPIKIVSFCLEAQLEIDFKAPVLIRILNINIKPTNAVIHKICTLTIGISWNSYSPAATLISIVAFTIC